MLSVLERPIKDLPEGIGLYAAATPDWPMNNSQRIDTAAAWTLLRRLAWLTRHGEQPAEVHGVDGQRLIPAADGGWSSPNPVGPGAAELFDLYVPLCHEPGPYVYAQFGQSLDGRIATESGASTYITGPEDRAHLHRLRALADAVVIGAGTAVADDPALTVRHVEGDNPVRVVIDSHGRVPDTLGLCRDAASETLILQDRTSTRTSAGNAVCLPVTATAEGLAIDDILATLRQRGLSRILVEGGGITISRFLQAGRLDRLHITVAPMLLGSGRPTLTLPPIDSLDAALRPPWRRFDMGEDMLFDLELTTVE